MTKTTYKAEVGYETHYDMDFRLLGNFASKSDAENAIRKHAKEKGGDAYYINNRHFVV